MLLRVGDDTMFPSPEGMPFFAIEPIRERRYGRPLLLVREPLANFALTLESSRDETADQNMQVQVLLAQTFLAGSHYSDDFHRKMWAAAAGSRGHTQRALVVAAILIAPAGARREERDARRFAVVAGWALRHPVRFARLFTAGRKVSTRCWHSWIAPADERQRHQRDRPDHRPARIAAGAPRVAGSQSRRPDEVIVADGSQGAEVARVVEQPIWASRGLHVKRIAVQPPHAVRQRVAAIAESRGNICCCSTMTSSSSRIASSR